MKEKYKINFSGYEMFAKFTIQNSGTRNILIVNTAKFDGCPSYF